jgi:type II secretory pathway component PulK
VLLISVLVCLSVVMLIFASWLRAGILQARQVRAQQDRLQAELLADSGLERAAAQLAASGNYPGETWNLDAAAFGGTAGGRVEIRVTPDGQDARSRHVVAVADFPAEGPSVARRSKEITIVLQEKAAEAP